MIKGVAGGTKKQVWEVQGQLEVMPRPGINPVLLLEFNHLVGVNQQRQKELMQVGNKLIHGAKHQQVLGETKGMMEVPKEGGNCFAN